MTQPTPPERPVDVPEETDQPQDDDGGLFPEADARSKNPHRINMR